MTELFVRGQSRKRDPVKIKLAVFGGLAGLLVLTGLFAPGLPRLTLMNRSLEMR